MSGKQKAVILSAALVGMLCLAGCESTELEQRGFPLAMGMDVNAEEGNETLVVSFDFPDLKQVSDKSKTADTPAGFSLEGSSLYRVEKSYENNTNKRLDYNHLKAVVLGESAMQQRKQLRSFLQAMEQQASARNASFFLGNPGAAKILSLTEETEGSVGKYLEEMIESQQDFRQGKIVKAGDVMNQWHNQDELLLLPVLSEKGKRPAVSAYGVLSDFRYLGQISIEEAMQCFLCQNLLEKFTWESGQGTVVEISGIRVQKEISGPAKAPQVKLAITGKGRVKAEKGSVSQEELQLEQQIGEQLAFTLTETGNRLQEKLGIDITDSYLSLGGYNRTVYEKYEGDPMTYAKQVNQVFQVDITLLDWE